MLRSLSVVVAALGLAGCGLAPFDLTAGGPASAPAGPNVAALLANLKCELFEAANNDTDIIPRYFDDPSLPKHYDPNVPGQEDKTVVPERSFTLKHLFEEIEYVGEAEFDLDVTSTPSISATTSFIDPYLKTASVALAVNGSWSDAAERKIQLFSSIDFERLVRSPPYPGVRDSEAPLARFAPTPQDHRGAPVPSLPCGRSTDLDGSLGIQEYLTYHFINGDMDDIAVWPSASGGPAGRLPTSDNTKFGADELMVTINFTVSTGLNGGPSWTVTRFKGPANTAPLLGYARMVKDSLELTLIPVCIRQKYKVTNKSPPFEYRPTLIEGTPRWANYLPQCESGSTTGGEKVKALSDAHSLNLMRSLNLNFIP